MLYQQSKFTVPGTRPEDHKICFFNDCANEGECENCRLIQGRFSLYVKSVAVNSKSLNLRGKISGCAINVRNLISCKDARFTQGLSDI